jgi:small-conductance mechanosensitive channel
MSIAVVQFSMPEISEPAAAARPRHGWLAVVAVALASVAAGASPPQNPASSALSGAQVLQFLDQTVDWYRGLNTQQQIATTPTDFAFLYDNRQAAAQAVRLAFEFARAEAASIPEASAAQGANAVLPQYQSLSNLQARFDKQVADTQDALTADKQKLANADAKDRQQLQAQIAELQGELDLANARRDAVHSMLDFVSGSSANGLGATGLRAQIDALARTVPGMAPVAAAASSGGAPGGNSGANSSAAATNAGAAAASAVTAAKKENEPDGIWSLAANVFTLTGKINTINSLTAQTDALAAKAKELRAPYVAQLQGLSSRGDELGQQANTASNATLQNEHAQFDALAEQFRTLAAAVVPLSKETVLLELYRKSLDNWKSAVRGALGSDLQSLVVRVGSLIALILIVLAGSELWRRGVYRYVTDQRRRYQFLLMRRFVFWFLMAIIIAFAFASSVGSLVTFAGLITAGVAVAMQGVIVAIVGYFFLIGKFGIRVGDRVQISGTTGEVIDVGLVRFHLMELAGNGGVPTGRVVAFSNSIVFQVGAGLFKQIHGTNFVWHELMLTLAPQSDFAEARKRLLAAVSGALAHYREEMERQSEQIARTVVSRPIGALQPTLHVRFAAGGLEVVIRYPVDLQNAAEIDEHVAREILKALEQDPKLQVAPGGALQLATESAAEAKS